MGKVILKISESTNGKSFSAFKYSYDTIGLPVNNYDDQVLYSVKEYGETATNTFLGTANYKSHEGSKPMSIVWELDFPIPAKYIKETQKMVAI